MIVDSSDMSETEVVAHLLDVVEQSVGARR
jgi:hypothetical protein